MAPPLNHRAAPRQRVSCDSRVELHRNLRRRRCEWTCGHPPNGSPSERRTQTGHQIAPAGPSPPPGSARDLSRRSALLARAAREANPKPPPRRPQWSRNPRTSDCESNGRPLRRVRRRALGREGGGGRRERADGRGRQREAERRQGGGEKKGGNGGQAKTGGGQARRDGGIQQREEEGSDCARAWTARADAIRLARHRRKKKTRRWSRPPSAFRRERRTPVLRERHGQRRY